MKKTFFTIGIGASAGGVPALIEFFDNLLLNIKSAFIVATHLMRDRPSKLNQILSRHTELPSGATISQTGGHGDFALPTDVPRDGTLSYFERGGMTIVADGADKVLMQTREQLRNGASQIKLMAGGGVASNL